MKRILFFSVIFLCIPVFSFAALTLMSDDQMEEVVGQAGVTLTFEDLFVTVDFDSISWGDSDGFNGNPNDAAHIRIDGTFGARINMPGSSVFTVDVSGSDGVVMGLPENMTIDVIIPETLKISVMPGADPQFDADPTSSQTLGYLQFNNPKMTITPSTMMAFKPH